MSSMGWSVWASHARNAANNTPPIANAARIPVSVHPFSGAWMMAYSKAVRPVIERSAPIGSSRGAEGSRDVGIRRMPAMRPPTTIGMFTRKIEPQ
jgi:hypothetical protein